MTLSLDAAVRTLLLPVKPGIGEIYGDRAGEILRELDIFEDQAEWVNLESVAWETTGTPSVLFKSFVEKLLYSPDRDPETFALNVVEIGDPAEVSGVLRAFSSRYFDLHARVMKEEKVDHQSAKRILSHTHTIFLLATGGRMTASRIYSILLKDGIALGKSWSTPRFILDQCGLNQDISISDVENLYEEDLAAESELLGDLNLEDGIEYVANVCMRFGYTNDLGTQLRTILVENLHPPYLCMIHFQLTILSIYNHRLTNAYEFKPRGEGLLWLSEKYNAAGLSVGISPFLNNAKSVDTLDGSWASSKKKSERYAARALADLLHEMDRLSEPSKSVVARYLRSLLHRILRTNRDESLGLANPVPILDGKNASNLLVGVAAENTGTKGVIEQRLTDCIALEEAGNLNEWRIRGIGDSVFTTNTSQKKFGDAEFKHLVDRRIVGVEAHGGRLTEKYVQDHLFTLRNVLPLRVAELEDRAPLNEWVIEIQFFAHDLENGMTTKTNVEGADVNIVYRRYSDVVGMPIGDSFLEVLADHFCDALNAIHVHPSTRQKVLTLI